MFFGGGGYHRPTFFCYYSIFCCFLSRKKHKRLYCMSETTYCEKLSSPERIVKCTRDPNGVKTVIFFSEDGKRFGEYHNSESTYGTNTKKRTMAFVAAIRHSSLPIPTTLLALGCLKWMKIPSVANGKNRHLTFLMQMFNTILAVLSTIAFLMKFSNF